MEKLIQGAKVFREKKVARRKQFYADLEAGQNPQCLFVTCADSRIVVSQFTQTDAGDVFSLRNAGNIVPAYMPPPSAGSGEWATIEYGLVVLGIADIVVCGHTHCGAMAGLMATSPPSTELPSLPGWLAHTGATRERVQKHYRDLHGEQVVVAAAMENVLQQLQNLASHPLIQQRLEQNILTLHGWMYELAVGKVSAYDATQGQFVPLNAKSTTLPRRYT